MPHNAAPPPVLDYAQVIAYAHVDRSVRWTDRQCLFVGDERIGPVPRLAICRNLFGDLKDYLLFHCDRRWKVLGATGAPTLRECKQRAERAYEGISRCWVATHTTKAAAREWLRQRCARQACSFCDKLPPQVDGMFSRHLHNVCFTCVREMHSALPGASLNAV